jgi:hypothetical protein
MKAVKTDQSAAKGRKLGDEWKTWDGKITSPGEIRVGNRLFIALLCLSILLLIAAAFFALYLISPRLAQYSERLPTYALFVISTISGLALLWLMAVILILKTKNRKFCFCLGNRFFFSVATIAYRIGRKLGISRDKVGHSFIEVSNALTLATLKSKQQRRVLILLPRCLTKEARDRILGICSRFKVEVRTVSGGEAARQEVMNVMPDAVVGIACERDLVSGIQDVAVHIPVFGIPNIRPIGPCKSTYIDYKHLEDTLEFVSGSEL